MADYKTQLYNVAIGTQGFMLTNTPDSPARTMLQAPVFGTRFASGDREYTDFTFWWYWAQTEWANGIKDSLSWTDDGKFYYSTNIDAWSEYGVIKLTSDSVLKITFTTPSDIKCGSYGMVGGVNYHLYGTDDDASGEPVVFSSTDEASKTNQSYLQMTSSANAITYIKIVNNVAWVGTRGLGNTNVVLAWAGTSAAAVNWTDHSAAIIAAMTGAALTASGAIAVVSTDIYLSAEDFANDRLSLMKYDGSSWTELATWADATKIFDMINFLGDIYYLKGIVGGLMELRVWDVSAGVDAMVREFKNDFVDQIGGAGKYLHILNGKLIITIPSTEIWNYDGANLINIWSRDDNKNTIGKEAVGDISYGGVYHKDKIWWSNLVYDGTYFFNVKKDIDDSTANFLIPLYTDKTNIKWRSATNLMKLYSDNAYKGTAGKNFLVFNQIDTISTIDKLFSSCNIIFKKLLTGQKIIIEYSADEMTTWTELGNVSYAVDGGTITNKTFDFSDNTIEKKLWLRVKIESGGTDTPALQDISIAYYPIPEYKQRWRISVNCIDDLKLLDGKIKETKRGEELRNILKTYWKDKNVLAFQDVDFAETLINEAGGLSAVNTTVTVDSTASFPEQGIIKLDKEKIKYTGRTALTFTGCTRGYEETTATTHADNLICSNGHKVIITDYSEIVPVGAEAKINEFIVTLELMET